MKIIGHHKSLITNRFKASPTAPSQDWLSALSLLVALSLTGCQGVPPASSPNDSKPTGIYGKVYGGQQPVTGASIQLYAAGNSGDGSAATSLLASPPMTDSTGSFSITGQYSCPASNPEVYLVATQGNPGLGNGKMNPQLAMMVALGAMREPVAIHLRNPQRGDDSCRRLCADALYADGSLYTAIQRNQFDYD